jgi:TetR/AcrR family transcriptional regulator
MAKPTFKNLNPEKKRHFLDAAFNEFALHDYHSSSISLIVANLGIAKGSVYQYFADKSDLYFHLLDLATTYKLDSLEERTKLLAPTAGFFELHRCIILGGAAFDFRNPRYSLLIMNAMKEPPTPELGDLAEDLSRRSAEFLESFVLDGVNRREVRHDLDSLLVVHVVNAVTLAVGPHMERKYGFSLRDQLAHPDRPLPFTPEQLEREVDSFVSVLRRGVGDDGYVEGSGTSG